MSDLIVSARHEAGRLGHDYIGSEHLLLALIETGDPALGAVLGAFSITPETLRERIEKRAPRGRGAPADLESIPIRSGARRVMDAATGLAGGSQPGSRHVLAALLADGKGIVATSLNDLGAPVAKVRDALGVSPPAPERQVAPVAGTAPPEQKPGQPRDRKGRDRGPKDQASRPPEAKRPRTEPAAPPAAPRSEPPQPPRIPPVHDPFLTWRKLPLLAIPLSLYFGFVAHASPMVVFITACVAVLPLAGYMGEATEHLSTRTGPTLGGFLNATFGNAAE
ncbi:MAG TPA: Clp protease N-terminal domain-containing protein, partial [Gemmatimonadales bacterium]